MTTAEKINLMTILLADDGSENMKAAIQFLSEIPHHQECNVTALRVFTPTEGSEFARVEAEAQRTRNLLKSRHFHYSSELLQGSPSDLIIQKAEVMHPDLVVLGSKATGHFGGLLGNVASAVVHGGKWPVLIARASHMSIRKVLLVTDGSESSQNTAKFLDTFPLPVGSTVEVMHVVQPVQVSYPIEPAGMAIATISVEDEERMNRENLERGETILETAKGLLPSYPHCISHLMVGEPIEQIIEFIRAEGFDLLVCGSRGAGNFAGWLMGSISRELVRSAPCSVLVFRS